MINKIYHISDVHIKLYKHKKQYINVLQNLISYIKETKDQNSIIILTGDIFHSKTQMSPEAIQMADLYFNKLSQQLPTIVIAGNHDANLFNQNRLDAITPIVDLIQKDNKSLYYYKNTGWYEYDNLNVWVASVFDERLPQSMITNNNKINICLYHGALSNVQINGIKLNGTFSVKDFSQFDYVLLGDIHKQQILSTKPLIAYAGSLIQLNFGQQLDNHGLLVWNLKQNTIQSVQIHNDYAYYNIMVQNGQIIGLPQITAKHPRIKIKYQNTNSTQLKQIQQKLKKEYQVEQMMLVRISQQLQVKGSDFVYNLQDINDVKYQENLLKQYIQHIQYKITEQDLKQVIQLNTQLNKLFKIKELNKTQNIWSLQKLQFSNFFSYGKNNIIQFNKHKGIVGIVGENRAGKTSLISTIMFMLYDRCDTTNKSLSLLNNEKNQLYGKLSLLINDKPYVIQRYGTVDKKRTNLPIKCKFYTYDQNGQIIDLSGTQRSSTNKIIQSYIGSYDDAIQTFFSTQGKSNTFIQMTNASRKSLFNSLLNLTIFQDCVSEANQRSKYIKGYLNNIDNNQIENSIEQSKRLIVQSRQLINNKSDELIGIQESLLSYQKQLNNLLQKKQSQILQDLDQQLIIKQIANIKKQITINTDNLTETNNKLIQLSDTFKQIEKQLQNRDLKTLEHNRQLLLQKKQSYDKLQSDNKEVTIHLKNNTVKTQMLMDLQYDQNCQYCMNNPLTKDAIQAQKQVQMLNKQLEQINIKLKQLEPYLLQLKSVEQQIKAIQNQLIPLKNHVIQQKSMVQKTNSQCQSTLIRLNIELQNQNNRLDKYNTNKLAIQNNKLLDNQIYKLRQKIQSFKKIRNELNNSLIQHKIIESNNNQSIKTNEKTLCTYNQKSHQLSILQNYKTIFSKNGLQYYITSNIITILQTEINKVLQMLANFTVQFVMDGKYIDIYIVYPNKRYQIQTCSGFQKFLMSIAIRHTLAFITNKSKGKIFVIDQGFGVLDSQNVSSFNNILQFIAQKYQTLIVVSHLEAMKSMFSKTLNIQFRKGASFVK